MVRRKIIKKLGFLDVNLNFRGDWELLIRIAKNYPFAYIAKPLAYYRVGYNFGILNDKFHASFKSEFKYILEKHLPKSTKKLADLRARAFNFYYMQLIRESLYDGKFLEGIAYLPNLLKRYVNLFW